MVEGQELFTFKTMTSSDMGGRWGKQHTAKLSADQTELTITSFSVDESMSGYSKGEDQIQTIDLIDKFA